MKTIAALAVAAALFAAPMTVQAAGHVSETGVVTIESAHDAATTIDRLAAAVEGAGAKVFARIDHAAGAASVDLELRPTVLLIFGNPKLGTGPMQAAQSMGMELPLRVVAWTDAAGKTFVSYNDPASVAARHGVPTDHKAVKMMTGALGKLTGKATAAE
ncbi:MAG: DUF302 domain-containing protein [Pseudomonadota bacterium]